MGLRRPEDGGRPGGVPGLGGFNISLDHLMPVGCRAVDAQEMMRARLLDGQDSDAHRGIGTPSLFM